MAITVIDAMNAKGQDWECSEVLRAEVRRLRGLLAAAEQRAAAAEAALATLLGHLPSDEVLSESWQGDMYWEDIFALAEIVPIYRAALTAPATQPDARAAAERALAKKTCEWIRYRNLVDASARSGLLMVTDEAARKELRLEVEVQVLVERLAAPDATDGAAKETT